MVEQFKGILGNHTFIEGCMDISIIVTAYNAGEFILSGLNSVRNQTYQSFELLVIDDGSSDNTAEIVQDFIRLYNLSNYRLIRLNHIGRGNALNFGIKEARHEWIAILDVDDLWNIHKLAAQVEIIKKYQIECLATGCKMFTNDCDVNCFEQPASSSNKLKLVELKINQMLCVNIITHASILFKKELAKYDARRKSQYDYELWLRLLRNGVRIYLLPQKLIYHRKHSKQFFESNKRLWYGLRSFVLQLKYCLICVKPIPAVYVVLKACHYMLLLARKTRAQ